MNWRESSAKVAAALQADAAERDRAGALPVTEVDLLRHSGLLEVLTTDGWAAANAVARTVAAADASIGLPLPAAVANRAGSRPDSATRSTRT